MTRKSTWTGLAVTILLGLPLAACKDTKTLEENEQLKAQVAELQKENGQLGNDLETVTAARDTLAKENETLKAEVRSRKTKRSGTKAASRKRRRNAVLKPAGDMELANRFLFSLSVVRKGRLGA